LDVSVIIYNWRTYDNEANCIEKSKQVDTADKSQCIEKDWASRSKTHKRNQIIKLNLRNLKHMT
jgi:hypothetical protein